MLGLLLLFLFFGISAAALVLFGVSLCRYLSARKKNAEKPGTYAPEEMKRRKVLAVICGVIAGVLTAVVVGLIVLLYFALAHM